MPRWPRWAASRPKPPDPLHKESDHDPDCCIHDAQTFGCTPVSLDRSRPVEPRHPVSDHGRRDVAGERGRSLRRGGDDQGGDAAADHRDLRLLRHHLHGVGRQGGRLHEAGGRRPEQRQRRHRRGDPGRPGAARRGQHGDRRSDRRQDPERQRHLRRQQHLRAGVRGSRPRRGRLGPGRRCRGVPARAAVRCRLLPAQPEHRRHRRGPDLPGLGGHRCQRPGHRRDGDRHAPPRGPGHQEPGRDRRAGGRAHVAAVHPGCRRLLRRRPVDRRGELEQHRTGRAGAGRPR